MSRILAIRDGALGDFLVTLPALEALQRRHSASRLEVVTRPAYLQLALGCGVVQGGRSIESAGLASLFQPHGTASHDWGTWLRGCEVIYSWLHDPEGIFVQNLRRLAPGSRVQKMPSCVSAAPVPAARQLAGNVPITLPPRLQVPAAGRPLRPNRQWWAVHPGSGSRQKNWPLERWRQALHRLGNEAARRSFLIITGEAEEAWGEGFHHQIEGCGVSFQAVHQLPLLELASMLGQCSRFLGHDSGVSHLAAACGVPCRTLFGPSQVEVWRPQGPDSQTLTAPEGDLAQVSVEQAMAFFLRDAAPDAT